MPKLPSAGTHRVRPDPTGPHGRRPMTVFATNPTIEMAVEKVRRQLDLARQEGRREPGRPTLVNETGLTDHAVRTALARIRKDGSRNPGDTTAPANQAT